MTDDQRDVYIWMNKLSGGKDCSCKNCQVHGVTSVCIAIKDVIMMVIEIDMVQIVYLEHLTRMIKIYKNKYDYNKNFNIVMPILQMIGLLLIF